MATIGYHASHEQYPPSKLLEYVRAAERAGFAAAMCSDHFYPWSERQGQSGFAWSWLGAAMQATTLPLGVVNAPGGRYHPAIIAQAAATLAEMFPGRFWLALGSGQYLNEHPLAQPWPSKAERNERLLEAAEVIRALWRGEPVTHRGHFALNEAQLYTRPEKPPRLVGAAITPETATWVGSWADALIKVNKPTKELKEVVNAFQAGEGRGKPMLLQLQLSYAPTEEEAERAAFEAWRTNIFDSSVLANLPTPKAFDAAAAFVKPDDLRGPVRVSADLEQHVAWLYELLELGFSEVYLHNLHPDQHRFVRDFGARVLPALGAA
jgi:coenzyme F420-dependent glucose-6-phosphate dehydrogenase